jgi:Transglycosylase SLT domain
MKTKAFFLLSSCLIILALIISKHQEKPAKFDERAYLAKTKNASLVPAVHERYGQLIQAICRTEKINPALCTGVEIEKVIIVESSGNPNKKPKNPGDGYGLMSVKCPTATRFGVAPDSLFVPYWNLLAGIRYLNYLTNQLNGDVPGAMVAYNCGMKKYLRNYVAAGVSPTDAQYYRKVKALARFDKQVAVVTEQ